MEWKPVMDQIRGGYWPGLDPKALLQFRRGEGSDVSEFRLCDQSPYFNVAGLQWRDPLAEFRGL